MIRRLFSIMALFAAWYPFALWAQSGAGEIIPDTVAARHGLTRCWFTQIEMDPGRSRLKDLVLYDGILYAQTDRAMVHAIDAETGATLWAKQIGRPGHPSMTPGVGRSLLAVVNGSRLYVADRLNGKILVETDIDGAPGAGPAVSDQRVYVPTVTGILLAYRIKQLADPLKELEKENPPSSEESVKQNAEEHRDIRLSQQIAKPISCQANGRTLVQPLVTRQNDAEEYIVWPTDKGCLYIGRIDKESPFQIDVKYRLEMSESIIAPPTYLPPDPKIAGDSGVILAASGDGYIYAIREKNGESLWRFSAGEPLAQPAVVIHERIYAATSFSGLHCIDVKTGKQIWYAPGVVQFASASKNRVYGVDKLGLTCVLDAATGAQLDVLPTASLRVKMLNAYTDRIYLATPQGLVQCLRETALTKPLLHGEERKQAAEEPAKPKAAQKASPKTAKEKPPAKKEADEK